MILTTYEIGAHSAWRRRTAAPFPAPAGQRGVCRTCWETESRALARSGPRFPLLRPGQAELFGFDPGELDTGQWARLASYGLHAIPASAVRQDPAGRAAAALSRLEAQADSVIVHFDVDVLDTGAFPLANFPHFAGLTLEEAGACLRVIGGSPKLAGLVVTR
jgi:arginase